MLHLFEGKQGDISVESSIEQSIQMIHWHLQEARRLLDGEGKTNFLSDATKLLTWLINKKLLKTSIRDIQRLGPLRDRKQLDSAMSILIEHLSIRFVKEENKTFVELNPYFF